MDVHSKLAPTPSSSGSRSSQFRRSERRFEINNEPPFVFGVVRGLSVGRRARKSEYHANIGVDWSESRHFTGTTLGLFAINSLGVTIANTVEKVEKVCGWICSLMA